ncbi:zf-DNL-domain-containing protein [Testicularia cyperi]|uniref:Zf-DNL-domain-containing protein n=1 Tax=Testicularia cyperi TaxID=1882483 RepID=A0A317Y0E7_9BASI|nr:zf-DNL-domain-containing protein [Testicularia cyperi]
MLASSSRIGALATGSLVRVARATAVRPQVLRPAPLAYRPAEVSRFFSRTRGVLNQSRSNGFGSDEGQASVPVTGERTAIGQIEQRLSITFTCAVTDCGHRSTHEFSKRSYQRGIVIVQCPGCKNRHLIADNLSWFTETKDEPKTIEEIIAAKGGTVRRGTVYSDGLDGETIEIEDPTTTSKS